MKVQRKLTIIIVMVLLTVVALGTSTYAWFTLNNIAKVDQIEMGITSGVGIDLSLDENADWTQKVWKSKLENSDFNKYIKDVSFDAVTSYDGKNFTVMNNDSIAKESNKFIELEIYFRASNVISFESTMKAGIYLVENNKNASYSDDNSALGSGTAIVSKGIDWKADVTFKYSDTETLNPGNTKKCYAKDAVRLSFTYKNGTETSKIFDLSTDSTVGKTPNYRGYNYQYGAADYYRVKNAEENVRKSEKTQNVLFFDELSLINEQAKASNNNSLVSVLEKTGDYYYGKTTLRLWIEGWDGDCFDSILSDNIRAQLKFQFGIY